MNRVVWESKIANPNGVHCRVAAKLTDIVAAHNAQVWITGRGEPVDCASILEVLSLSLIQGSVVAFTAEGPDAELAAQAINRLLSAKEEG
jgi:phosphocarrier protein HPr